VGPTNTYLAGWICGSRFVDQCFVGAKYRDPIYRIYERREWAGKRYTGIFREGYISALMASLGHEGLPPGSTNYLTS
jgi:hypothetical protein